MAYDRLTGWTSKSLNDILRLQDRVAMSTAVKVMRFSEYLLCEELGSAIFQTDDLLCDDDVICQDTHEISPKKATFGQKFLYRRK
ncbi:hypothetical protein PoB_003608300 [Plakobranchus ocellatus]|uniref:Uncharacterized protein n=1 Tax=Plakobranchus ocellatus TaxID=259542 RepID=A0AAV4AQE7_9GAST|nr:hypothetical protein PoB_003608300 [Plakobranchus ocellatus]